MPRPKLIKLLQRRKVADQFTEVLRNGAPAIESAPEGSEGAVCIPRMRPDPK